MFTGADRSMTAKLLLQMRSEGIVFTSISGKCRRYSLGGRTVYVERKMIRDPAPHCSYGHSSRAQCDCGPIASNE